MDVIQTVGLTKCYGKNRGIDRVDLTVREGEIYGFIGPNGAGKSTTIRLLLDFIRPTGGAARVFGLDCVRDSVRIKRQTGYIPSDVRYYEGMRVGELLSYSAAFYRKDCAKRAAELCVALDLDASRRVEELSTGNRKKVAIAQAMLHEPRLLVMDEPTSGLDPLVQNAFYDLIRAERERGVTVFFSSHVLSEVQRICDRVGIIREGKLIEEGAVGMLAGTRYKRVKLVTADPFEIEGAENVARRNGTIEFMYAGGTDRLLRTLAAHSVENVWIEDPPLEDIFMAFYREGGARK